MLTRNNISFLHSDRVPSSSAADGSLRFGQEPRESGDRTQVIFPFSSSSLKSSSLFSLLAKNFQVCMLVLRLFEDRSLHGNPMGLFALSNRKNEKTDTNMDYILVILPQDQ